MSEDGLLHPRDEEHRSHVLVTGANTGLGFAICCRLMDEFIVTRPSYQSLTLILTTRNVTKSKDTVARLQQHLSRQSKKLDILPATRITLQPEQLDLTSLQSIHDLANNLLESQQHLDTVILNAGYGAFTGIDWLAATWSVLTNFVDAITYPTYKLSGVGYNTAPQIPQLALSNEKGKQAPSHPPLGQVFTSNVFGHYVLSHALMALLSASPSNGRIIFVSSIEAVASSFNLEDIQGLKSATAYENSKRLTDILALSSSLPSTAPFVKRFLSADLSTPSQQIDLNDNEVPASRSSSTPHISLENHEHPHFQSATAKIYLTHPGICATAVVPLPLMLFYAMTLLFYIARLLGSPWHNISAYKGACAPVWLALTDLEELEDSETEQGKGKWGSACDVWGNERVMRTGVDGWGLGGRTEEDGKRRGGLRDKIISVAKEEREEFEDLGRECWRAMETLRVDWNERMRQVEN